MTHDPDQTPKRRFRREPIEDQTIDESELRGNSDWFEAIGPEDEDDDIIEEGIEQYGWEQMDEGNLVSEPTISEQPDWSEEVEHDEAVQSVDNDRGVIRGDKDWLKDEDKWYPPRWDFGED
jgi:hypothetical protein